KQLDHLGRHDRLVPRSLARPRCPTSSPKAIEASNVAAVNAISDRLWRTSARSVRGSSIVPAPSGLAARLVARLVASSRGLVSWPRLVADLKADDVASSRRWADPATRLQGSPRVRARLCRFVAVVRCAIPDLHPVPDTQHDDVLADPHAITESLRDRDPALAVQACLVGGTEEQTAVRAGRRVGKGERRHLVGTPL